MKKRLFIAINLPDEVKKQITAEVTQLQNKLRNYQIRFLSEENWHLTISFLGYQDDADVGEIIEATKTAAKSFTQPIIKLEKMVYGPPGRTVRMIWLVGSPETSKNLAEIKEVLEDNLESAGIRFNRETRPLTTHLTLARFEPISTFSLPPIEKGTKLEFEAKSLDLMQSVLKRSGAEYMPLSVFAFRP